MFPSQHPWQVLGEQGTVQTPFAQTWLAFWQEVHCWPPVPQLMSAVPGKQIGPLLSAVQQPFGQFCGVHGLPGMHMPSPQ
jgi:hypothetical protein